jgi:hypothetical protein
MTHAGSSASPNGVSDSSPAAFGPKQAARRREMVEKQLRARGVRDPRVPAAMLAMPRHAFVPELHLADVY